MSLVTIEKPHSERTNYRGLAPGRFRCALNHDSAIIVASSLIDTASLGQIVGPSDEFLLRLGIALRLNPSGKSDYLATSTVWTVDFSGDTTADTAVGPGCIDLSLEPLRAGRIMKIFMPDLSVGSSRHSGEYQI